jgi:pimeloyl-ACP methyl ester carboxylesterase
MRPMADLGYRVFAADIKGHGLSDKPVEREEYTLASLTSHVREIAGALGLNSFHFMGHSMGARIGIALADQEPAIVERLFLVNPVGFGPMPHVTYALPISNTLIAGILPAPLPAWLVRFPLSAVYGRVGRFTDEDLAQYRAPTQFREFLVASVHLLRAFDWSVLDPDSVAHLRDRSHIVAGALDRVVHLARSGMDKRLERAGWRVGIVRDAAHIVHEETPDEVIRMVAASQK